jgi:hypothetical protein
MATFKRLTQIITVRFVSLKISAKRRATGQQHNVHFAACRSNWLKVCDLWGIEIDTIPHETTVYNYKKLGSDFTVVSFEPRTFTGLFICPLAPSAVHVLYFITAFLFTGVCRTDAHRQAAEFIRIKLMQDCQQSRACDQRLCSCIKSAQPTFCRVIVARILRKFTVVHTPHTRTTTTTINCRCNDVTLRRHGRYVPVTVDDRPAKRRRCPLRLRRTSESPCCQPAAATAR